MGRYSATTSRPRPWWRSPVAIGGLTVVLAAGATVGIAQMVAGQESPNGATSAAPDPTSTSTDLDSDTVLAGEDATPAEPTAGPGCAQLDALTVAAAPGIVPVLEQAAPEACIDLEIVPSTASVGATSMRNGEVDAWVPDSREYALAAGVDLAAGSPSLAWSPVVMVADTATAAELAVEGVSWGRMMADGGALGARPVSMPGPDSGIGMSVADKFAATAAGALGGNRYLSLSSAAATLSTVQRFDATTSAAAVPAGSVHIVEAREVTASTGTILVPADGVPVLEYPWVVLNPTEATERLREALATSPAAIAARAEAGLLEPGTAAYTSADGTVASTVPVRDINGLPAVFALAGSGNKNGNSLVLLDVSGSMNQQTPEGTLLTTVTSSSSVLLRALDDGTKVGLWEFSYLLDGVNHHREIVASAPLSSNRDVRVGALGAVRTFPDGGTALYSSTVDAVAHVQANWDPDRVNLVLALTDGREEDAPGTLDLSAAIAALQAANDPQRPVSLMMFGYGEADIAAMQELVDANGGSGGVFPITNSAQVLGAFAEAVGASLIFP